MSATPSSSHSTASGAAHAASARAAHAGARKPGAHGAGTDHFSLLMSLLSATGDAATLPALMSGSEGSAADPRPADASSLNAAATPDSSHLAAVMQWMGLPQNGSAKQASPTEADTDAEPTSALGHTTGGHGKDALTPGQVGGDKATPGSAATPLPAGMQLLNQPEAPDSATLAALNASASADEGTPVDPAGVGDAAPTPAVAGAGRSFNAHAPANTHAHANPGSTATQAMQLPPVTVQVERLQARPDAVTGNIRSTLSLDERFSTTTPTGDALAPGAATSAAATAPTHAGSGSGGDLSGQAGNGSGQDTPSTASSGNDSNNSGSGNPEDGDLWAAEERAQNEERLDTFTTANLHEAKLRVGDADGDAIDISLSLSGQELDLGFRTDSAEARAALASHAQGSLGELLQRSGIQLGDVSVGAQNGQNPNGHQPPPGRAPTASPGRAGSAVTQTPSAPLRPRSDGNRPLDLFI